MCVFDQEDDVEEQQQQQQNEDPDTKMIAVVNSCKEQQQQHQVVVDTEDDTVTTAGSVNSSQNSLKSVDSSLTSQLLPQAPNSKIKIMCSYGGRILPRPHDGQLRYVGGETRILLWQRSISYAEMMAKLVSLVGRSVAVKYQLPNEDLDALISVVCEEDFGSMIDEYMKMEGRDSSARLRLFLFFLPAGASSTVSSSSPRAAAPDSRPLDQQFIEALNGMSASNGGGGAGAGGPPRGASRGTPDEDMEYGNGVAKPGPIKMHRQLSASDRIDSGPNRRVSPRTSPRAHGPILPPQQDMPFHEACKPLPPPTRENSAGRTPQEIIDPVVFHHYYPAGPPPDPCSRQAQQQHYYNTDPLPPSEAAKGLVHHDGESPKKPDHHNDGHHAPPNGYLCVKDLSRCQTDILVNRQQYNLHHRQVFPVPAASEQQLYPCSCRAKVCPSLSRFRDGQQQQQMFHDHEENRMLLRPVLVPSHPQHQHQQQQVYEPGHHHHRLAAEKNGSRTSDLDRQLNHHQQQQQPRIVAAAASDLVSCAMV